MEFPVQTILVPDPLDSDDYVESSWFAYVPGFINEADPETGDDAILRQSNLDLYESMERLAERNFREALQVLSPFLDKYQFRSLQIYVDILGHIMPKGHSLAGFNYVNSSPQEGLYIFNLDRTLLYAYLRNDQSGEPYPAYYASVWVHELIHMLDLQQLIACSLYRESDSTAENRKYFLLKYRNEGIASLYELFYGERSISTLSEALGLFAERVKETDDIIGGKNVSDGPMREEMYKGYSFYSAGPWVFLAALDRQLDVVFPGLFSGCIKSLERGEPIPTEKFHQVLRAALRHMDCARFLEAANALIMETEKTRVAA